MRVAAILVAVLVLAAGCTGPAPGDGPTSSPAETTRAEPTAATPTAAPTCSPTGGDRARVESILESGRAAVTLVDDDCARLAVVNASVADTNAERYRGLSDAERLPNGTGMLFVFPEEGDPAFVMREMDFPLDVVFVGADGTITAIYHAPVEDDGDLTRYRARAQWVLEVPYGWTNATGVDVGDSIHVEYPENATLTPTPSAGRG